MSRVLWVKKLFFFLSVSVLSSGCTEGVTVIEELTSSTLTLIDFNGKTERTITINSPSASLSVTGTCDKTLGTLQVSVDGSAFQDHTAFTELTPSDVNCADGSLTISSSDLSSGVNFPFVSDGDTHTISLKGIVDGTAYIAKIKIRYLIVAPTAVLSATPSDPDNLTTLAIDVGGTSVTDYRYDVVSGSDCTSAVLTGAIVPESTNITDDISGLADGPITVCAIAFDGANWQATGDATSFTWVKDTTAPLTITTLTLTSPGSSPGNIDPSFDVSPTTAGDTIRIYTDITCVSMVDTGTASSGTSNMSPTGLTEGSYTFYATAEDSLGNVSPCSTASLTYTLDTTPPADPTGITLISPTSSPSGDSTPTLSIVGTESGSIVELFVDDSTCSGAAASAVAGTPGTTSITTPPLSPDGTFNFSARAYDNAGNYSSCFDGLTYTLDATPPVISGFTPPSSQTYYEHESVFFDFQMDESVSVDTGGGTPYVEIDVNGSINQVEFQRVLADGQTLRFEYSVQNSDVDPAVTFQTPKQIVLNGGTIYDQVGNSAGALSFGYSLSGIAFDGTQSWCDANSGTTATNYNELGSNPYYLCTADQLENLAANCNDSGSSACGLDYELKGDIDVSSVSMGPIGSSVNPFTGTFEGNFRGIMNLTINTPALDRVGLFGETFGATISNFLIGNFQITGNSQIGGLIGYARTTTVNTVIVSDASVITGNDLNTGGLIGEMSGSSVTHGVSYATVNGVTRTGGLIGLASETLGTNTILRSLATGDITGVNYVGGLIGSIGQSNVSESYATGDATASTSYAAGLIAEIRATSNSTVANCYAEGSASASSNFGGGLLGYVRANSAGFHTLDNNYATGAGSSGSNYGAFNAWRLGANYSFSGNFYDNVNSSTGPQLASGASSANLQLRSTFEAQGWDFNDIWMIDEGSDTPRLKRAWAPTVSSDPGSSATLSTSFNSAGMNYLDGDTQVVWTAGNGKVRTMNGQSGGQYYYEVTINDAGAGSGMGLYIGFASDSASVSQYVGAENTGPTRSWGCKASDGTCHFGGTAAGNATISSFGNGDVLGVAVDLDTGEAWFSINGSWQSGDGPGGSTGDEVFLLSNSNGVLSAEFIYPAASAQFNPTEVDFEFSSFTYTAPAGFNPWPQ